MVYVDIPTLLYTYPHPQPHLHFIHTVTTPVHTHLPSCTSLEKEHNFLTWTVKTPSWLKFMIIIIYNFTIIIKMSGFHFADCIILVDCMIQWDCEEREHEKSLVTKKLFNNITLYVPPQVPRFGKWYSSTLSSSRPWYVYLDRPPLAAGAPKIT